MGRASPVTYRDTLYPSQVALAKALGITRCCVSLAVRDGWVDQLGTGGNTGVERMNAQRRQPCAALGWSWPSQRAAARAMGVTDSRVCDALALGRFDDLVRQKLGPKGDGDAA